MLDLQDLIAERYLIRSHLHHGYMSDVYHAYDQQLKCDVAIKVVCHDQTESRLRLHSEIKTLSSLTHDHILPILDFGEYGIYQYLVMPYFKQGTLLKRISKEMLTAEETGKILGQITRALQFAHDHDILHRDIKPSNILLVNEIDPHVYLADFGLAKAINAGSDITQTGFLIGTPEYMAPELIDKPESVSSDIYALGVLIYHMLTGQPPFSGGSPIAVLWKHVHERPIPPSRLNSSITPPVEQVILRALHKDPQRRFSDVRALAQAYTNALQLSEQTKVPLGLPIVETKPALITLKKVKRRISSPAALQSIPLVWRRNHHLALQRITVSLALMAIFIIPLSLGFLVGRNQSEVTPALSAAQFSTVLHKISPPVSTPKSAPHVFTSPIPDTFPVRGKTSPTHKTPSVKHHKPKDPHRKHKDNNTNGDDNTTKQE